MLFRLNHLIKLVNHIQSHFLFMSRNPLIPILLTGVILSVQACSPSGNQSGGGDWGMGGSTPSVEVVQASFGSLPLEERLSGTIRAKNQIEIYPRISAPIQEIYVNSGDEVRKGEPLLKLRDNEYAERVRQAEANLKIAEARVKQSEASLKQIESRIRRERVLAERQLSSELEMEALEAELESARAGVALSEAQLAQVKASLDEQRYFLDQTLVRAPISGTVGQRNAEIGMQASPSSRLFVLGDLSEGIATVYLTEKMLSYIKEGQRVRISTELAPDTVFEASVSRISPFLQRGSFSTTAEIDIAGVSEILVPGMFVTVDILYGESEQATLLPLSAIYQHPRTGVLGVYRAPDYGIEIQPEAIATGTTDQGAAGETSADAATEAATQAGLSGTQSSEQGALQAPISDPTRMEFIPIQVIAKGREAAGVIGVTSGDWVVSIGQNLLVGNDEKARVRPASWERILGMQRLRTEDLIEQVIEAEQSVDVGQRTTN